MISNQRASGSLLGNSNIGGLCDTMIPAHQ
jgi:hypothetical protein